MPRTLRARLFLTILLPMLALIVGTFFAGVGLNQISLEFSMTRSLEDKVSVLQVQAEQQGIDSLSSLEPGLALADSSLEIVAVDAVGGLLPSDAASELAAEGNASGAIELDGTRYVYAAAQTQDQVLILLRPFREEPALIPAAYVALGLGFGLPALVIAVLVAVFASRAIARPLKRVGEAGRQLAAGDPPAALPVKGPRELRALASSFNEMAEELTRAREAERTFLMSVSHELKTPLAAIQAYAEGLEDGVLPPDEAGKVIAEESQRLERLVTDLLTLARLREARFTVNEEAVSLSEIVGQVIHRHEPQARLLGIHLETNPSLSTRAVLADRDRLVQAVSNLVENALRYAPENSIVTIEAEDTRIAVSDQGPGLTSDDLAHVFERFFLYRRYSLVRPVGTGLGLALVKELVEAMAGTVKASSRPGEGATFTIDLRGVDAAGGTGLAAG